MSYTCDVGILDKMPWLNKERKEHIISTAITAKKLAKIFSPDIINQAFISGIYHDCAKGLERELAKKYESDIFDDYFSTLHAPLGAYLARDVFGIEDNAVLDAIKWHCTGKAGMTTLEKIVFLADAIEPLRNYPNVETIRTAAFASLDNGIRLYTENLIGYLQSAGNRINPYTLQCYEFYRSINE